MFCLVGLGNPGPQYEYTRHNAGFLVINRIISELNVATRNSNQSIVGKLNYQGRDVLLVKPQTFMNCSGRAVREIVNYYRIDLGQLLVIHDDLDLKLGTIRLRCSGSSGGHRGLGSIIDYLQTDQICRLKLGIGRPGTGWEVADYVLAPVEESEQELFMQAVNRAAEAALDFVVHGPLHTMNNFNGVGTST
ncbi:MAG TPA: aminoacyl-tRNA hydrolase [Bacillota bacterium]